MQPAAIPPVVGPLSRPFWSVMMPTYNAGDYFIEALSSVLSQDPGEDQMEIVVVDDCSPNGRAEQLVKQIAPGRVRFHSQPRNVGLAENWNTCIRLSCGRWVHILHQDDRVLPGFYNALSAADKQDSVGAAFCRPGFIDGAGCLIQPEKLEQDTPGILANPARCLGSRQVVQCPCIVVRRDVYEEIGGFRPDLKFAVDWEMWLRIAVRYEVWYEPQSLAHYRSHQTNESSRLRSDDADLADLERFLAVARQHLRTAGVAEIILDTRRAVGGFYHMRALEYMREGRWWQALRKVQRSWQLGSLSASDCLMFHRWALKVVLLSMVGQRGKAH